MKQIWFLSVVLGAILLVTTSAFSFTMTEDFTGAIINKADLTSSSGLNQWNDLVRWQISASGGYTDAWAVHTPNDTNSGEESLLFYGWDATGMGTGSSYTFSLDFLNDANSFIGHAYIGGLVGTQKISRFAPWPDLQATSFDSMYLSSGIDNWGDGSIYLEGTIAADYDVLYIAIQMGGYGGVRGIDNVYVQVDAPVPEPATILLLGGGLAGLAFYRRKRK